MNHQKRSEVYTADDASALPEVMAEVWKAILISIRVLERDENMKEYVSVSSFPSIEASSETVAIVTALINDIVEQMVSDTSPLFQDAFARSIKTLVGPSDTLLVSVETTRCKSRMVDYEDADEYVPTPDEMLNNEIPDFPFPTVYDFISEINRPAEPNQANQAMRFNFRVKDLKYDVEKMKKKKKNPQEIVDSINTKLTRLANWKDVLLKDDETMPDPFAQSAEWGERIKLKYQSLKALAADPKKALDTQYDKRKTFIKIIDQWSDRLKRSFKFVYQSQREYEDFATPILRSKWRNEIVNASKLFSQTAFLDMKGPNFEVGNPAPVFDPERYFLWDSDYPVAVAMFEMMAWFEKMEYLLPSLGGSIRQHTYSRGFITERVLTDFWKGIAEWVMTIEGKSIPISHGHTAKGLLDVVAAKDKTLVPARTSIDDERDHTDIFLSALDKLNRLSRDSSAVEMKPVKEMYRDNFFMGKELVDWWTTLVRDMDLVEDITIACAERGNQAWSDIMADIVYQELEDETKQDDDPGKQAYAEQSLDKWKKLYPVMKQAEAIAEILPWDAIGGDDTSIPDMQSTLKDLWKDNGIKFDDETVSVALDAANGNDGNSYLFVAPRFFRGIGLDEELPAFLEFSNMVEKQMTAVFNSLDLKYKVTVLHPQLVDKNSVDTPLFASRAPHPAILVTLVQE